MKRTILSTLPATFVSIVEQGSVTAAATELMLAKSAVSQNLKRLESQLGVKLAIRSTRTLSLTPAGEQYYRRCKQLIALAQRAATEMEAFGAAPSGPLTLTAPHAMIAPIIAPAIAALVAQYPQLRPRLIADDRRLDIIAQGIDLAITIGKLKDSELKARHIGTMRNVLCLGAQLAATLGDVPTADAIQRLQSLPYIAHERENRALVRVELPGTSTANPVSLTFRPQMFANTVEALLAMARQGLGVALLPDFAVAADLRAGRLIQLFADDPLAEHPVFAVHAYDNMPPQSVQAITAAIGLRLQQRRGEAV